jgi:futalosine hydrolase
MNTTKRILVVAATKWELCGQPGLVCGVGPVEAAAATAHAIALDRPDTVLHVGVAGGRGLAPGTLVVGTRAVYCDLSAAIPVESALEPDEPLLAAVLDAVPDARALVIGTSAAVNGPCASAEHDVRVEGMEGFAVLRACARAGIPAVEVRAISNELGQRDRARWQIETGLESLAAALPKLLAAAAK